MKKIILSAAVLLGLGLNGIAQTKKQSVSKTKTTTSPASANLKAVMLRGKGIYDTYCLSCHQADGGGVPNLNAPLIKSANVVGPKNKLIDIILTGMQGVEIDGETYSNSMPAFNYLSEQQIADVLTFVRNNFGNKASAVTIAEVKAMKKK